MCRVDLKLKYYKYYTVGSCSHDAVRLPDLSDTRGVHVRVTTPITADELKIQMQLIAIP